MRQVVYLSHAVSGFSGAELGRILAVARLNNRQAYVTGLLLFDNRQFLQALEGESAQVAMIFDKIRADSRHVDISILGDREVAHREFGNWAMAANEGGRDGFARKAHALVSGVSCPSIRTKFANFVDYA